jgi:hypothetical protein
MLQHCLLKLVIYIKLFSHRPYCCTELYFFRTRVVTVKREVLLQKHKFALPLSRKFMKSGLKMLHYLLTKNVINAAVTPLLKRMYPF